MHAIDDNFSRTVCVLAVTGTLGPKADEFYCLINRSVVSILALSVMVALFAKRQLLHCSVTEGRFNSRLNDGIPVHPVLPVSYCRVELEISIFGDIFSVLPKFILTLSGLNRNCRFLGITRYSGFVVRHCRT